MSIIPIYNKKLSLKNDISNSLNIIKTLEVDISKLQYKNELVNENITQKNIVINAITLLESKKKSIEAIINCLSGFKLWLYKNVVIPNITDKTNYIIEAITDVQTYKLAVSVDTNKDDIKLTWFINNSVSNNIIEKSGGFRKFIAGLALRIAINSIGASSIQCSQLFLDEGFVSADSINLSKIPDFISSLLNIYGSVILVSHLDIIKESADISIAIKKDNLLSQLSFGTIEDIKKSVQQSNLHIVQPPDIGIQNVQSNILSNIVIDINKCNFILKNGKQCQLGNKHNGTYCKKHINQ